MWSPPALAALICACFVACLPEFDPDLGASSVAPLCGLQGAPCCEAPAAPCDPDLLCDPAKQLCTRPPVLSCSTDDECDPGDVCCMSGFMGTCASGPIDRCPELDLLVATPELDLDAVDLRFFDGSVAADRCLIDRGCVGAGGWRRLLGVSTTVDNGGPADLLLGSPDDTSRETITTCGGEPRFAKFLLYELLDSTGPKASQEIAASCSPPASDQFIAPFSCDSQGLWSGFSQVYPSSLADGGRADDCGWLDITDLLPGEYTLRVTVNSGNYLGERNVENNTPTELSIQLPAFDPSERCPDPPNPLLGSDLERECGWARAAFQADARTTPCNPGEEIALACRSDRADYRCGTLRICDGADVCSYEESIQQSFSTPCFTNNPPSISLACPASGQYSLWLQSDARDGFTCEPYVFETFDVVPEIVPDAGAPVEP